MGKAYLYWADLLNDDATLFEQAAAAFQQVVDLGIYQLEDDMQELFRFGVRHTKSRCLRSNTTRFGPVTGAGLKAWTATG